MNIWVLDDFPVFLSVNQPLYNSNEEKRMACFGTIPEITAPNPLYNAKNPSFATICLPTEIKFGFCAETV